jgi:hypothetical protein
MAALVGAYTPPAVPQTIRPLEAVPIVDCAKGAGSAFRVGPNILLSVKHVTNNVGCQIDGQPIHITYTSPTSDFSILSDDRTGKWIEADCRGFVTDHHYIALGHARGLDQLFPIELVATGEMVGGMAVLIGVFTAQPGQSGGAVIDADTGHAVGTVNAADWEDGATFSVPLKDTPICKGRAA